MVKTNKKIGLGSLSILLWVFGILFSFTFGNQGALGDRLLEAIGLSAWSNGDTGIHYTILYSYLFSLLCALCRLLRGSSCHFLECQSITISLDHLHINVFVPPSNRYISISFNIFIIVQPLSI